MKYKIQQTFHALLAVVAMACASHRSSGAPLTRGNILVTEVSLLNPTRIREITPSGSLVQTLYFPTAGTPKDISVDKNGNIAITTGEFEPVLKILNPTTGLIVKEATYPGWSTVGNITYGATATLGNRVFLNDMWTANGEPNGIICYNVDNGSMGRFGSGDYIDLTAGLDGLLYALFPGGSPGGLEVDVFDPLTFAFKRRIAMAASLRTIAVDANGEIFGATISEREIYRFDRDGKLLQEVTTTMRDFGDANISRDGRLVFSFGDNMLVTDTTLTNLNVINIGNASVYGGLFTAWIEPPLAIPEPTSLVLGVMAAAMHFRHRAA